MAKRIFVGQRSSRVLVATALRKQVRETLNALSRRSQAAAGKELDALVDAKKITDLEYHWIVNGFTCRLNREHLAELKSVPGVRMVYFAGPPLRVRGVPAVARSEPYTRPGKEFVAEQYKSPWYVESSRLTRSGKSMTSPARHTQCDSRWQLCAIS